MILIVHHCCQGTENDLDSAYLGDDYDLDDNLDDDLGACSISRASLNRRQLCLSLYTIHMMVVVMMVMVNNYDDDDKADTTFANASVPSSGAMFPTIR